MTKSVDDILRDDKGRFASGEKAEDVTVSAEPEPTPSPEPNPEPQPEPQAKPEPVTAEPVQQQPVDPDSDPKNWTYAAYRDEKAKRQQEAQRRQAAEQRARELEARFAEQQRQTQAPDIFADPDGYRQHQESALNERIRNLEANFSLRLAHKSYGETFEQAYQAMVDAAEGGDRSIVQQVIASPDPGEAIVRWFKREQASKEIGDDPAAYKERLKAEILAELQAKPTPQPTVQPKDMPSNLAGTRSVGVRTGPDWSGPQPIKDIFDRRAAQLSKR